MNSGEVKGERPSKHVPDIINLTRKKAIYSPPRLIVYGSVSSLTRGKTGCGNDGGTAGMSLMSDPGTKEHIVRIGDHPLGIGLYLFDYRPQYREQSG